MENRGKERETEQEEEEGEKEQNKQEKKDHDEPQEQQNHKPHCQQVHRVANEWDGRERRERDVLISCDATGQLIAMRCMDDVAEFLF